jgi:hypothetical protein
MDHPGSEEGTAKVRGCPTRATIVPRQAFHSERKSLLDVGKSPRRISFENRVQLSTLERKAGLVADGGQRLVRCRAQVFL